jgi:hypothetical protein
MNWSPHPVSVARYQAMKDRLLADLDARIARHASGDSSGVLEEQALAVVSELVTTGAPDAGSLARVAALHLCRYQAQDAEHGEVDRKLAVALYTNLHTVDPRLVPSDVRDVLGLASPHDTAFLLLGEYKQTGQPDQLERAISLLRQEVLEDQPDRANCLHTLGIALLRRFDRFGEPADLHEAIECSRGAIATAVPGDARQPSFQSGLAHGLLRRFELTTELSDVDDAIAICRAVVTATTGEANHAMHLANLAGALLRRYELTGQPTDHDEAVEFHRRSAG